MDAKPDGGEGALFKRYAEMNALFERLNISPSYINARDADDSALSFSYRAARGEYRIYIRKNLDMRTRAACDLREKGRILFNHFIRPESRKKQFYESFRRNMPLIFFRLPDDKNPARQGMYPAYIYERFIGAAQAMEVNSKLFGDCWDGIRGMFEKNMADSVRKREYISYPKEGWPLALDWTAYMLLLCGDMRWGLDQISGGDGNGIRTGDIGAYNREGREEERIKEAHETRKTIVDGGGADGDERVRRGRTASVTGTAALHTVSECDDFDQFISILRERGMVNRKRRLFTDMLYNINRNKFNTDVFIPRRLRVTGKIHASVCILLDVSGSVPTAFLERIVSAIVRAEGFFDRKKSRLVCWSDSLCSDNPMDRPLNFTAGGGTILAGGIEYCKKYLDEDASFFVVSDFQDDLADWIRAAKTIKTRKTAVAYIGDGEDEERRISFSEWFSRAGSNSNSHKTEVTVKEFSTVFDAVLLRRGILPAV